MGERGTDAELTVLIGADGGEYSQSFLIHTTPYPSYCMGTSCMPELSKLIAFVSAAINVFGMHRFRRRSSHLSSEFPTFSTKPTDIQLLPPLTWKLPTAPAAALASLSSCQFSVQYFFTSPPCDIQGPCSHSALKSPFYECPIIFLPSLTSLWMCCLCTQKPKYWLFPRLCLRASSLHTLSPAHLSLSSST